MGRKKHYNEPRRNLSVRLSAEERTALEKNATENNMCLAEYVRQLIMAGGRIDTNKVKDRRDLIEQIARIGNNINQLTRIANTNKYIDGDMLRIVENHMEKIRYLLQRYMEALK